MRVLFVPMVTVMKILVQSFEYVQQNENFLPMQKTVVAVTN